MAKMRWKTSKDLFEELKRNKNDDLNKQCQDAILSGFDCEIGGIHYHFSYDQEAQINLQDTMRLFENNMVETVNWNARLHSGKVRLTLTKEQFEKVYVESVKHKLDTISKYRDELLPLVNQAKTKEELEAITWDTVPEAKVKSVLNTNKTIEKNVDKVNKKTAKLEVDNDMTMSGLLELTNMVLMGGMM